MKQMTLPCPKRSESEEQTVPTTVWNALIFFYNKYKLISIENHKFTERTRQFF